MERTCRQSEHIATGKQDKAVYHGQGRLRVGVLWLSYSPLFLPATRNDVHAMVLCRRSHTIGTLNKQT